MHWIVEISHIFNCNCKKHLILFLILAPEFEFVKIVECHQNLTCTIIWDNLVINKWSINSKLRALYFNLCDSIYSQVIKRIPVFLIYIYTFKLLAHLWIILIRAYLLRSQLNVYLKTMFLRQTEQSCKSKLWMRCWSTIISGLAC